MSYETHYERYKELNEKYNIAHGTFNMVPRDFEGTLRERKELIEDVMLAYDVVVDYAGAGYAHQKYRVLRNTPNLSAKDLAIICDKGNLCFGYRAEGSIICVYTD